MKIFANGKDKLNQLSSLKISPQGNKLWKVKQGEVDKLVVDGVLILLPSLHQCSVLRVHVFKACIVLRLVTCI